ncbi:MAG: hypothetical protein RI922_1161 [Bacteroidota bacterium]|jgi:hypothetical protein
MERISIFNYEAFYLDFLEGTLSEEETALFLAFLEEHPELQLEDENLFAIEGDQVALDASFKENLKQLNFESTAITLSNVEQFLIAQTEGLLSSTKRAELNVFLSQDPSLLHAQRLYANTKLNPDLSIVFEEKSSLKQARRIALWPILSMAAAASVAVFLFLGNPSTDAGQMAGTTARIHVKLPVNDVNQSPVVINPSSSTSQEPSFSVSMPSKEQPIVASNIPNRLTNKPLQLKVKKLMGISVREVDNDIEEQTFAQSTITPVTTENVATNYGFQDMKNPIKPITNRLSDVVKQEVDFRTAKATEKTPGGFYLKIGKLEISHRNN